MKPITVVELAGLLTGMCKKGYGNHIIAVSDDDELNGTHCLWGGISLPRREADGRIGPDDYLIPQCVSEEDFYNNYLIIS